MTDVAHWPQWWPGIGQAHVLDVGAADRTGARAALLVKTPLGYRLRFTVEVISASPGVGGEVAAVGDLRGTASWTMETTREGTRVTFVWCIVTRRWVVRLLRPFARWAHARVMAAGNRGLARVLAVR